MHCLSTFVFSLPLVLLLAVLNARSENVLPHAQHHRMLYKYLRFSSAPKALAMSDQVERRIDDIAKSVGDSRVYRGLILKNGLTALLISDPDTDKSAASLSVAVGKF